MSGQQGPPPDADTTLYSTKDLEARWSKSADTIRGWIEAGHLRAIKVGRRFYVPAREVARLEGTDPAATNPGGAE